jgi:hypothetical protein
MTEGALGIVREVFEMRSGTSSFFMRPHRLVARHAEKLTLRLPALTSAAHLQRLNDAHDARSETCCGGLGHKRLNDELTDSRRQSENASRQSGYRPPVRVHKYRD